MLSGSIHNRTNKVDVKEEIKYTRQSLQESHQFMVQPQMQRSYSDVGIVKLGVQELLSLGPLSSSTKDKLSRSPLDPWRHNSE